MIRLLEAFDLFKDLVLSIYRNKLVGRAESIHQQRKWRYRFSDYTTGRVETFRFLERPQPRFETVLWLVSCRAADEYSQLWKRKGIL